MEPFFKLSSCYYHFSSPCLPTSAPLIQLLIYPIILIFWYALSITWHASVCVKYWYLIHEKFSICWICKPFCMYSHVSYVDVCRNHRYDNNSSNNTTVWSILSGESWRDCWERNDASEVPVTFMFSDSIFISTLNVVIRLYDVIQRKDFFMLPSRRNVLLFNNIKSRWIIIRRLTWPWHNISVNEQVLRLSPHSGEYCAEPGTGISMELCIYEEWIWETLFLVLSYDNFQWTARIHLFVPNLEQFVSWDLKRKHVYQCAWIVYWNCFNKWL